MQTSSAATIMHFEERDTSSVGSTRPAAYVGGGLSSCVDQPQVRTAISNQCVDYYTWICKFAACCAVANLPKNNCEHGWQLSSFLFRFGSFWMLVSEHDVLKTCWSSHFTHFCSWTRVVLSLVVCFVNLRWSFSSSLLAHAALLEP